MLIVISSVLQLIMFSALALGSIYEQQWLTGGALVVLMISLYLNKLMLEESDVEELDPAENAGDPYLAELVRTVRNHK